MLQCECKQSGSEMENVATSTRETLLLHFFDNYPLYVRLFSHSGHVAVDLSGSGNTRKYPRCDSFGKFWKKALIKAVINQPSQKFALKIRSVQSSWPRVVNWKSRV